MTLISPIYAVVPAAGIGSRMQSQTPKQYLPLYNKTVIEHTLDKLIAHDQIKGIVVALHKDDIKFRSLPVATHPKVRFVIGGVERSHSVISALQTLAQDSWALVHDAARPCVNKVDISELIATVAGHPSQGAILASPVKDTMKRGVENKVLATVDRKNLWHALTPQLFHANTLLKAYQNTMARGLSITDEASAMEQAGHRVELVVGQASNIKITEPADLALANFYLQQEHTICE